MSRLIDADALMELIEKTHCTGCNNYNKVRCRACSIGDMLDYLDDAPTVDQWHYPSKEGYPDEDVECLVYTTSGNKFIAIRDSTDKCWFTGECFDEFLRDDCVACWQYIVPPKEEA